MPDSDNGPATLWPVGIAALLIAASSAPAIAAVVVYPINKGTVYVGPITFFLGVSLALCLFWSAVGAGLGLWIHFKKPSVRRQAWSLLCAGECAFCAAMIASGAAISFGLEGRLVSDWVSTGLLLVFLLGLVVSLRRAKAG